MLVSKWLRTPRVRRSVAAGSLVLSIGGLVLLRAPASSARPSNPSFVQINTVSDPGNGTGKGAPSEFKAAGLHGTFGLDDTRVLAGGTHKLYAELRVTADKVEGTVARAPLSIAVVLDRSGSMEGVKLQDAKRALSRLIDNLKDDDEIAFVKYDDSADLVQPLARVGAVRSSLQSSVNALTSGGGTNIAGGLRQGELALANAKEGHVKRVILLSDGIDSTQSESERIASQGTDKHVTASSIGIGLDFNEAYMSSVARSGHGNFAFVNDTAAGSDTALATFMNRELTQGAATTVVGSSVRIHLPAGVSYVASNGADGHIVDGNDLDLHLGDLAAGEERRVLVELTTSLQPGDTRTFDGKMAWSHLDGSSSDAKLPTIQLVASKDEADVNANRDEEVTASAVGILASKLQLAAIQAYNEGRVLEAIQMTNANANAAQSSSTALGGKLAGMVGGTATAATATTRELDQQAAHYRELANAFGSAAPSSAAGRAAAKSGAVKDSANLARPGYVTPGI